MSGEEIKTFWDNFADEYEKTALETTTQLYHQMLSLINLNACTNVLETGCGTGACLEILRKSVPSACQVTGSDYSPVMVQKSLLKHIENCQVLQEDNQCLSFGPNTFDAYIANLSLHLVPDPLAMLSEAFRVLRPAGTAVFSVWGKPEDHNLFVIMKRAEESSGIPANARRSPFHLNDQDRLNQIVRDAGFVNVRSFYTSCPFSITDGDSFANAYKYSPGYKEIESSNPEKFQELVEALRREAAAVLDSGRLISFDGLVVVCEKPVENS